MNHIIYDLRKGLEKSIDENYELSTAKTLQGTIEIINAQDYELLTCYKGRTLYIKKDVFPDDRREEGLYREYVDGLFV